MLAEAEELEARTRSRGLIVDEDTLYDFYDERVPESIVSQRHFDRWWDRERRRQPGLLTFSLGDVAPEHEELDLAAFPDVWPQGDLTLPLTYQLSPGSEADGVTVHIPVAVLARVVPDGFDWMVPGMAAELATATIRALPKTVRRLLVPAPDAARDVVAWLAQHTPQWEDVARAGDMAEPYREAFTRAVRSLRDVEIPADAWDGHEERLPAHLRVTFRVEDGREVLGDSTSLLTLQRRLAPAAQAAVSAAVGTPAGVRPRSSAPQSRAGGVGGTASPQANHLGGPGGGDTVVRTTGLEQDGLATWPILAGSPAAASDTDTIPAEVTVQAGSATVRGYPALAVEGGDVSLRVLAHADAVPASHAAGVAALLLGECAFATKRVTTRWSPAQTMALAASPYRTTDALVTDLHRAAIARLTGADDLASIRDRVAYEVLRDRIRAVLEDEVLAVAGVVADALAAHRDLDVAIGRANSLALLTTLADLRAVAGGLVYEGFVAATPADRLPHLTRYLTALTHRLDKAASNPHQDAVLAGQVRDVADVVDQARAAYAAGRPDREREAQLQRARWLVEELRVSLFAQKAGTSEPVSAKRILKELG
ncbi:hypothetical protein GCM10025876_33870 [Demequina litorisediminis]|uniref:RNA helicase HrpA C-terminal domain-containing protein n=1 Tax=Demequina litorisediminis TaxID=1849022 RepID=A0ABQ6IJ84_9MICO|nr:hypothetical protein GCM10025876_33870 [Demequina litorisediminis]